MRRPGQMELARVVLARHLKRVGVRLKAKGKGVGLGRASAAGLLGSPRVRLRLCSQPPGTAFRDRVVVIGAQLVESTCLGWRHGGGGASERSTSVRTRASTCKAVHMHIQSPTGELTSVLHAVKYASTGLQLLLDAHGECRRRARGAVQLLAHRLVDARQRVVSRRKLWSAGSESMCSPRRKW